MCIISILSMLCKDEELWNRIVVGNSDSSTESFIVRFVVKISKMCEFAWLVTVRGRGLNYDFKVLVFKAIFFDYV